LKSWLGKTSQASPGENLLTTPEGREEARRMLAETRKELESSLESVKELKAFYKERETVSDENIRRIDALDQRVKEDLERVNALKRDLAQRDQQLAQRDQQLAQRDQQLALLQRRYRDWKANWTKLNKNSPSYEADKERLVKERQKLEDELTQLERGSTSS
jgi:chromosome segregation ATPase